MAHMAAQAIFTATPRDVKSSSKAQLPRRALLTQRTVHTAHSSRRAVVVCAEADNKVLRRDAILTGFATLATSTLAADKAEAFGLGGGAEGKEKKYVSDTTNAITTIKYTIALAKTDPDRPDAIVKLKGVANEWVARYRRDGSYSGRPSYGYVYSAFNAVQGHYNNFGTKAPIPKKRALRIAKELSDAELALSRGR